MTDLPDMTEAQDRAIRDAIADYAGVAMVTDYVIVAQGVNADGEPGIADIIPTASTLWSAIGMLRTIAAKYEHDFAAGVTDE